MYGGLFSWRPPRIASRMNRTWSHHGGNFLRAHFNQHAYRVAAAKAQRIKSALDLTLITASEAVIKSIVNVAITIKVVQLHRCACIGVAVTVNRVHLAYVASRGSGAAQGISWNTACCAVFAFEHAIDASHIAVIQTIAWTAVGAT